MIRPNDFLFTAGMVGLAKVLRDSPAAQPYYKIKPGGIELQAAIWQEENFSFPAAYRAACLQEFGKQTVWQRLADTQQQWQTPLPDVLEGKLAEQFDHAYDFAIKAVERSSYQSAYAIIAKQGDTYSVEAAVKALKKEKSYESKRQGLQEILTYIVKHRDVLAFKDIAYTKINLFWKDIAFLNSQNSKKDMLDCMEDAFIVPLKKWKKPSKVKLKCLECGSAISKGEASGMAWLHDMGVDHIRKRSYFWNMNPDVLLCPLCTLIYACAPLGFIFPARTTEALFVNNNGNFSRTLRILNSIEEKMNKTELPTLRNVKQLTLESFLELALETKTREIHNMQVIIRTKDEEAARYQLNIVDKQMLHIVRDCQKSLTRLVGCWYDFDTGSGGTAEDWNKRIRQGTVVQVYDVVLDNLLQRRSQYPLIHAVLQHAWGENSGSVWFLWDCLSLEWRRKQKEGQVVSFKETKEIAQAGKRLRDVIASRSGDEDPKKKGVDLDNKVRGYAYQLLNALQSKDSNRFMSVATRMYIGMGLSIPSAFITMMASEETFLRLGYAYILGLKGATYDKEGTVAETPVEQEAMMKEEKA